MKDPNPLGYKICSPYEDRAALIEELKLIADQAIDSNDHVCLYAQAAFCIENLEREMEGIRNA